MALATVLAGTRAGLGTGDRVHAADDRFRSATDCMLPGAISGAVSVRPQAAGTAAGITGFTQMAVGAVVTQYAGTLLANSDSRRAAGGADDRAGGGAGGHVRAAGATRLRWSIVSYRRLTGVSPRPDLDRIHHSQQWPTGPRAERLRGGGGKDIIELCNCDAGDGWECAAQTRLIDALTISAMRSP